MEILMYGSIDVRKYLEYQGIWNVEILIYGNIDLRKYWLRVKCHN